MLVIMVGRKFFMALIQEFQQLCRILSCRNVQTSPTHSNVSCPVDGIETVNTDSEQVVDLEVGNKSVEMPTLSGDPSLQQDHVLNILREEKTLLKEPNFSPYAPLPAIGKSSVERPVGNRIVRQHTYRVLEPVYIKGPLDMCKFTSVRNCAVIARDTVDKKARSSLLNNVHPVKRKNHDKLAKTLENRRIQFTKSAFGLNGDVSTKRSAFQESQEQKSNKFIKENNTSFWIEL